MSDLLNNAQINKILSRQEHYFQKLSAREIEHALNPEMTLSAGDRKLKLLRISYDEKILPKNILSARLLILLDETKQFRYYVPQFYVNEEQTKRPVYFEDWFLGLRWAFGLGGAAETKDFNGEGNYQIFEHISHNPSLYLYPWRFQGQDMALVIPHD